TSQTLHSGSNLVKRIGFDAAGNRDSASVRVFLDTVPPLVEIDFPLPGAIIHETSTAVAWRVDGVSQGTQTTEALAEGVNLIVRTSEDSLGNSSSDTVQVTYTTQPPMVQILSPAPGATVFASPVAVEWSVDGFPQTTQLSETLQEGVNTITRTSTYDG